MLTDSNRVSAIQCHNIVRVLWEALSERAVTRYNTATYIPTRYTVQTPFIVPSGSTMSAVLKIRRIFSDRGLITRTWYYPYFCSYYHLEPSWFVLFWLSSTRTSLIRLPIPAANYRPLEGMLKRLTTCFFSSPLIEPGSSTASG